MAQLLNETARLLQAEGFEAAFAYAMDVLREYPSCDMLAYGFAASLLGGLEMAPPAAGREAFEAGLPGVRNFAVATSPLQGFFDKETK